MMDAIISLAVLFAMVWLAAWIASPRLRHGSSGPNIASRRTSEAMIRRRPHGKIRE